MSTVAFQKGTTFEIDRRRYQLVRKVDDDTWQAEECRSGRLHDFGRVQLLQMYARGDLKFTPEALTAVTDAKPRLLELSGEQWELAKVRRAYVTAVLDLPSTRGRLQPVIEEVWRKIKQPKKCPNVATVIAWKRRYLHAGKDICSLMHHRSGNTKPRFSEGSVELVAQAIEEKFLCLERGTIEDTLEHAKSLILRENKLRVIATSLEMPTRRLVTRMIYDIPAFDRYVARYGRTAAVKKFRAVLGHRTSDGPLGRAEIDHTLLDLIAIDDKTSLPLGRPYVTACIDDYTRCILGIFISFEPPSYFTVARCLRHVFLPKVGIRDQYPSIENEWCAHGVMRELVVDNGPEFHSESLENVCLSLNVEIHYAPRKQAWFKGKIERYLGTLNRAIAHKAPGTTFNNILEKGEYDPAKHAVVRYSVLKEIAYKWICDVYQQKPHRTLKIPPAVMWQTSISAEDILVPENPDLLDAILGRTELRRLTHKGIELNSLFYNSLELQDLRKRHGAEMDVDVRVDAADIGWIIVLSPDQRRVFKVPALNMKYAAGVSEWQHKVIHRFAAHELGKQDVAGWLEAKAQIADMIDREFMRMKKTSRKRIARYVNDERISSAETPRGAGRTQPEKEHIQAPEPTLLCELQGGSISEVAPVTAGPGPADEKQPSVSKPAKKTFNFVYRPRGPETSGGESDDVCLDD